MRICRQNFADYFWKCLSVAVFQIYSIISKYLWSKTFFVTCASGLYCTADAVKTLCQNNKRQKVSEGLVITQGFQFFISFIAVE